MGPESVCQWHRLYLATTGHQVMRLVFELDGSPGHEISVRVRAVHEIYSYDTFSRARISIIKDELFKLLPHEDLQSAVILVYANKQDLKDAMSPAEITDALSLHSIKNHDWHIQACSALTGDGLYDGLGWIAQQVGGKATS
ncbi:ADP-ribosylation factor-like protein 5 [Heracleum sosnowskyi]|uniref:ADP-ribosylation factor-like protein 5 n=1 Tax=Heracleum sosnowskyi TaxID=360622 RepID=A0AAD8IFE9_9APIA|nr:ADP-ribosylation factor-like protein 5 [Heracleum sosnowskyi]